MDIKQRALALLPEQLQDDDRAVKLKKLLIDIIDVISIEEELFDKTAKSVIYPEDLSGILLDNYGVDREIFRRTGENDDDYRKRIQFGIIKLSVATSIPSIQEAVDSMYGKDSIYIYEIPNKPATIGISSNKSSHVNIMQAIEGIKTLLPAGVSTQDIVATKGTWQHIKDDYGAWSDLNVPLMQW